MKLLQITDTHIPAAGELIYGVDARARLDACIEDINRHHADADLCIVTGDLVNHGAPAEYENLKGALDRLRVPLRLMVGNHDDRGHLCRFFPNTPLDEDGHLQSAVDTPVGRLVLLDTHDPGRSSGVLCERRLAWLSRRLAERPGEPVYLFLHHPPLRVGIEYMDDIGLRNPDALWECLAPHAERIRFMVFGHLHRPISGLWKGIPFAACPSTVHQIALELGRQPERRLLFNHEPPCYAIFQIEADRVIAHQQRYTENWKTFERQGEPHP
jgi:3',5'-cyclic AMP phosphodiesterase CpdA